MKKLLILLIIIISFTSCEDTVFDQGGKPKIVRKKSISSDGFRYEVRDGTSTSGVFILYSNQNFKVGDTIKFIN